MDEEDGRPGNRAGQFGPLNAPAGVAMKILCPPAVGQTLAIRSHKIRRFCCAVRRAQCKSQNSFFAKHRNSNHTSTIPAPYSWRGPAEGVCPTAGGGEHHENVPGK
jgi:hypothetical protein